MTEKPRAFMAGMTYDLPKDAKNVTPRPLNEVAEECIKDGVAHLFYRALSRVYEKGNSPIAADVQWTPAHIDICIQHKTGWFRSRALMPVVEVTKQG